MGLASENDQLFSEAEFSAKKRETRRVRFLGDMEQLIPWPQGPGGIERHYPKGKTRPAAVSLS